MAEQTDIRAEFEAWFSDFWDMPPSAWRKSQNCYTNHADHVAYRAWLAGRESVAKDTEDAARKGT